MKVPCYGCPDRKLYCHSNCPKYLEWRKKADEKIEKRILYHQQEQDYKKVRGNQAKATH